MNESARLCVIDVAACQPTGHAVAAREQEASTLASAKSNTLAMTETAQKNPVAVGVGGAPGGHRDEQRAVAALDKTTDQPK